MCQHDGTQFGRRDFIKTTTIGGMAAALSGTALPAQDAPGLLKSRPDGLKKNLLCVTDSPPAFEKLLSSVKSANAGLAVNTVTVNYQKAEEVIQALQGKETDILLVCLPRSAFSFGNLDSLLGRAGVPMVLLAQNPDLILIDANFAAALRANGANVLFATSQEQALELVKAAAAPRILEGKKALVFGRPFDSTSVPAHNLNADFVYRRTGVRIEYRSMDELKRLFDRTGEAEAAKEAARWKKEAAQVMEASDKAVVDACRLYVLLRSLIEKEGLSAVSIDCLALLFNKNTGLPHPCLSFSRLRDEGYTAACEADVCAMLASMFLQEISRRPSFLSNVLSVNVPQSGTVLSHCVAPLRLAGAEAPALPYRLRDYHGMGQGAVPEVEFPVGMEITAGAFTKDLKSFVLWPGRIQIGSKKDADGASSSGPFKRMTCANYTEVKIRDADRFLQNIAGHHHIVVAGNYSKAIGDALLAMNVGLIGPSDLTAPA